MADILPADTTSPAIANLPRADAMPEPTTRVDAWNQAYPSGTWVIAYPGARGHRHLIARTRTMAFLTSSGSPAVFVRGYGSYIALTHVDPIAAEKVGGFLEQEHWLLDLDADSQYTIPGAVYGSYLNLGGQS